MLLEAIRSVQAEPSPKAETKPQEKVKGLSFKELIAKLVKKKTGASAADAAAKAVAKPTDKGDEVISKRTAALADRLRGAIPAERIANIDIAELANAQVKPPPGADGVLPRTGTKEAGQDQKKTELRAEPRRTLDPALLLNRSDGEQGSEVQKRSLTVDPKLDVAALEGNLKQEGRRSSAGATLKVVDLRTAHAESPPNDAVADTTASIDLKSEPSESSQLPFRSVEIDVRPQGTVQTTREQPVNNASLFSELKNTANAEIVRNSGIVLRDGGDGEIRLNLKPENLGNVRIRLSLHDNQVTGRIIVENSSVREVFEQNLDNLYRAFKEGGFDASGLQVSVGGEGFNRDRGHEYVPGKLRRLEVAEETSAFLFADQADESAVNLVV